MDLDLLQNPLRRHQLHIPVYGDGMMNRRQGGESQPGQSQKSISQALIVVNGVVVPSPGAQEVVNPPAEGEWFREAPGAHG